MRATKLASPCKMVRCSGVLRLWYTASDPGNVPYKLLELRADIERALDMVAGAALLYRHLILDRVPAPGDAVVVGDDHARIVHTAIDQTWKELSDILELAAELQEAVR